MGDKPYETRNIVGKWGQECRDGSLRFVAMAITICGDGHHNLQRWRHNLGRFVAMAITNRWPLQIDGLWRGEIGVIMVGAEGVFDV